MKRTGRQLLAFNRWITNRAHGLMRGAVVLAAVLLSACSASSSDTQTGNVAQTSSVPLQATATTVAAMTSTVAGVETPTAEVLLTVTAEDVDETPTAGVATAEVVDETPTVEAITAIAADVSETSTAMVDAGGAPVTAAMEQLGVAGERFAAIGDPNAPVTVIEFSDYG